MKKVVPLPEGSGEVGRSSSPAHFDCYYSRINHGEVRAALQKTRRNKAVGPDQIPIEAWKCLGYEGVKWLTCLFSKIFSSAKMPNEWRRSEVIPVYQNKGYAQACNNYRGIKLLSHTMKLWERVIERMLKRESMVLENHFGFMPERSTTEAIHLLRSLMEKYRERQRDLHMAFLDLEKAYDSVLRELVWKTLLDKGTPKRYSRVIKDIEKTEYLRCDFGRYEVVHQEMNIPIRDQILQPKESFRYLGSVLHRSGRIVDDVAHRIRAGWMKLRAASGVLCDKRIPLKLKEKFYRAAIRPAMLYGSKCWPITKALAFRMKVAELSMLRWTCGKTMVDMISNEVYKAALDVDSIIDKMREGRLRWFGHVKRRPQSAPVRRVETMVVEGSRRRGRPKLRCENRL
nr:retrovirus-related Pol polyprotein LINE-1 [Tanacetum cinerariifolium]